MSHRSTNRLAWAFFSVGERLDFDLFGDHVGGIKAEPEVANDLIFFFVTFDIF